MQEMQVQSLGQKDHLKKVTARTVQYSWLENPMDKGDWQATVHGVAKESDLTWQLNSNNNPYTDDF